MYHQLYKVMDFEIVGDYLIRVIFDDGSELVIDFEPAQFIQLLDSFI